MSGLERREAILSQAISDPKLVSCVSPVVAAGFGIIPLRRLGDVFTVACSPRANPAAIRLLREVLDLEVVATPFEEHLIRDAIDSAYLRESPQVNFPTFRNSDFLDDPGSAAILGCEKSETFSAPGSALSPERVTFATLAFRTRLTDADAPTPGEALPRRDRSRIRLGELDVAWRLGSGGPIVFDAPDELGSLVMTQYRESEYRHLRSGGWIDDDGVESDVSPDFPLVIHPTEVQLLGLSPSGGLRFHLYDEERVVEPGQRESYLVEYHFLSYGSRMTRRIELDVLEVVCVERDSVTRRGKPCGWGPGELGRWFGLRE
ncbi:MAG: hypothetical protein JKY65_22990 [Planctomycetes bacterium]|nr:hypothetical protein [Planctomycetota bacterium]